MSGRCPGSWVHLDYGCWGLSSDRASLPRPVAHLVGTVGVSSLQRAAGPIGGELSLSTVPSAPNPCTPPAVPGLVLRRTVNPGKAEARAPSPLPSLPPLQHPSQSSLTPSAFLRAPLLLCGLEPAPTLFWTLSHLSRMVRRQSEELAAPGMVMGRGVKVEGTVLRVWKEAGVGMGLGGGDFP